MPNIQTGQLGLDHEQVLSSCTLHKTLRKAMYVSFKDKGIDFAKQAVVEDEAGNYDKALQLYLSSLDYFKAYLKYEKNPKYREMIMGKVGFCTLTIVRSCFRGSLQCRTCPSLARAVQGVLGSR